ncbi:hypothetical protein IE53DRAFT_374504 [Violaceomyces palustris]|uniref:Uncharacterized protein n=1 Tax=Violaceomyces palustris TaxID=1673888 RepID=A0ACD0NXQ0_9BASI|nr:hypothetical protein IE53DRAFT_374504 [Violaceomyces palustris]
MDSSPDPLQQAIALQGVESSQQEHEPKPSSSSPDHQPHLSSNGHPQPDQRKQGRYHEQGDAADDDDLVVFDASSITSPQASTLARMSVESLSFGYRDHLLPLSLSGDPDESWEAASYGDREGSIAATSRSARSNSSIRSRRVRLREPEKSMGLVDGIALTVGVQVGSGIFSSPGVVTLNTGSIGASLVVWLLSGILAWTGASSYAELGASIPLNGGAQAYLNYSFGPLSAFLYAWSALVALKPGSGAIVATIFGEYVARMIFHATSSASDHPHEQGLEGIPGWSIKLIACSVMTLITVLHAFSSKLGTRMQIATTSVKVTLIAVPILSIVQAARGKVPETSSLAFSSIPNLFKGSSTSPSSYALALYSGLWAFDGWDQSSFIAGEMKRTERDLPRVIHASLAIVLCAFLAAVTSYFVVLPSQLVKRTNTVALDFGSAIFGTTGGILFAFLVAFSCFGALNGQVYTTSRLISASSREGYLPRLFGDIHGWTRTPLWALGLQWLLTLLFILFGSGFASLVNFYGVCSWFFYFVTVLGLLVLRVKEPHLARPYRTWLSTPIVFAAVALFLLLMPVVSAPMEALAALGFILAGVPVYFMTQGQGRAKVPEMWGGLLGKLMGGRGKPEVAEREEGLDMMTRRGRGRGGSRGTGFREEAIGEGREEGGLGGRGGRGVGVRVEMEEEGEEEEAVEMLPKRSIDSEEGDEVKDEKRSERVG